MLAQCFFPLRSHFNIIIIHVSVAMTWTIQRYNFQKCKKNVRIGPADNVSDVILLNEYYPFMMRAAFIQKDSESPFRCLLTHTKHDSMKNKTTLLIGLIL